MSNPRSTGHIPLKTSMTNKWKSQAPTSELLERQTRALEDSLNRLKLAMNPDKTKTTTDTTGPIWDRGKSGPLSHYANHVLRDEPRKQFDANKPTKIRVLTDEPAVPVNRPSIVANMLSAKSNGSNGKTTKCGQCEKDEAKMKCLECAESYCTTCFAHFHLRGALQRHRCVPLSESRPSTPQKKKKTVGADVIFKELRVAQSKDDFLRNSTMATEAYEYIDDEIDYENGDEGRNGGELLTGNYDEKTSAASFQQALMQWRQQGNHKKKGQTSNPSKKKSTHEVAVDTVYDTNGEMNTNSVPNIEFSTSKLTYAEKLLVKKYRRSNKNNQEFFNQRTIKSNAALKEESKRSKELQVNQSLPEVFDLRNVKIDIEPMYDELSTMRTNESARTIIMENDHHNDQLEEQDDEEEELLRLKQKEERRPKSRASTKPISRPNSSAMRKNSATSRPSSVALFQHPLPSLLQTNPSEEFKSIVDPQSRPSSAALKKPAKPDYRLPSLWNRNWKPEQSMSDGVDVNLVRIDQAAVTQFDLALNDLLDEDKIENAGRSDNPLPTSRPSTAKQPALSLPPLNPPPSPSPLSSRPVTARSEKEKHIESSTPTPRQSSLFNLSNSPSKVDSSSSIDAGDGGFFTDVNPPRKSIQSPAPPPVAGRPLSSESRHSFTQRSARSSVEQRPAIPNLMSLRKTSIEALTRPPPKRSITLEETHNQIDDYSRPGSSLSSASLPVSVISSKPDLISRPLIERYPKVNPQAAAAPQTIKKFRVEFQKKSAPPTVPAMVIEGKKVTSASTSARDNDDYLQQSMNSTRGKISAGVQRSQNVVKASTNSSMTTVTRDENALKDESLTITDAQVNKSITRRSTNTERKPTKSRTMEFTVRDGVKWQHASSDSVLSKSISTSGARQSVKGSIARPSTPSNTANSKLAHQFSTYDMDDGRSSRACQDVCDEQSFNQLREELCSELGMNSPGWDASLSEHVLKNLRGTDMPFSEKELQDNLNMLEIKLRSTSFHHLIRRYYFTNIINRFYPMEIIQEKAKLADERIQQLKSLIATTGTRQLNPEIYVKVLQDENDRLKKRVQSLVDEIVTLENERGVKQQYDFVNKVPKAPTQSSTKSVEVQQPRAEAAPAAAAAVGGEQAENKDKKDKKKKPAKEEKPAKAPANNAIDITRFDLRVGKIVQVEKHPDADSLYVEQIDVGEEKPRTVCSGLVKHMPASDLDQKMVIVLCNLKPAKMRGIMSEGMVMCASTPDKVEFLEPPSDSKPGDRVECEGYDCTSPDAQIKKELSDQILPDLNTNDKGEATFKGILWKVGSGKGVIKAKSLVNVPIR
ncbi:unnamed protein product [Adineta ricciae]|uniref:tRNA-binding domain-containing protein n=1 Tax=Adineta ricciae TaxID=249248 RepID=A0A814P2Q1_ADIRI|nr:unnamed protein product [Adineta ricciae]